MHCWTLQESTGHFEVGPTLLETRKPKLALPIFQLHLVRLISHHFLRRARRRSRSTISYERARVATHTHTRGRACARTRPTTISSSRVELQDGAAPFFLYLQAGTGMEKRRRKPTALSKPGSRKERKKKPMASKQRQWISERKEGIIS